jgi:hypothetical protein
MNASWNNPLEEPLEGKTKFRVKVSMYFDVIVPDEPPDCNGQTTGLSRACNLVERELVRGFNWRNPVESLGLIQHLRVHSDLLSKLGIELVEDRGAYPSVDVEASGLDWWDTPEGPIFTRLLFQGCGDYSARDAAVLRKRFENALSLQGGCQQPGHPETEEQWKEEMEMLRKCDQYIEDAVRDIATALLGREITFGKELPYP